jgi:hypothetical protein
VDIHYSDAPARDRAGASASCLNMLPRGGSEVLRFHLKNESAECQWNQAITSMSESAGHWCNQAGPRNPRTQVEIASQRRP